MTISKTLIVALLCTVVFSLGTYSDNVTTTATAANDVDLFPAYNLSYVNQSS
jgi:hypothetical protein